MSNLSDELHALNGRSLPEVVGDAAILFDPLDSDLLSRSILKVINDERLRKELVGKGLENVKNYSWKMAAAGILKSCEKALLSSPP